MTNRDLQRMHAVDRQLRSVRDLVNHTLVHGELFKDQPAFLRVCAAMDLAGDSSSAMNAFLDAENASDTEKAYLLVHGLYQSVSNLLDCCRVMAKHMNCSLSKDLVHEAMKLQDIRVEVSGHPHDSKPNAKTGRKGGAHGIAQYSLNMRGFRLHRWHDDGSSDIVTVIHSEVVRRTLAITRRALKQIIRCLRAQVESLEEEWMKSPTTLHFKGVGYACEKLLEAIRNPEHGSIGEFGVDAILDCVNALEADSRLTDHWKSELKYHLKFVREAAQGLRLHFNGSEQMNDEKATIYARYICDRINEMWQFCREIDDSFSEQGE